MIKLYLTGKKNIKGIAQVTQELSKIFESNQSLQVEIIESGYNDLMQSLLIVSAIQYARKSGTNVSVRCKKVNQYLQRMNFYSALEYNVPESFNRHNSADKLLEICNIRANNANDVVNGIMQILQKRFKMNEDLYSCLNYCFWEIVDNIQT